MSTQVAPDDLAAEGTAVVAADDPLARARALGFAAGRAAGPLEPDQVARLRVLLRGPAESTR